jgi:hypothetical protein
MKPRSTTRPPTRQTGYALILMVLALMGIGGGVIASFTQGAKQETEHERFLHNQRVLKEAKQGLLQYAYNYPVLNSLGPGRLPNADTDNDGVSNGGSTFGRFPWAQPGINPVLPGINLYDIRDADGERLWYAVSSSFRPQAVQINSQTSGTITLRDQSGNVIFDGSNPGALTQYGVAAVIIAPGAPIARAGVVQNRAGANVNVAANYLDLVGGTEDNADFTNSSAANGLILGPVNNLVNDQFIVITAAEVIAMAEKATLQAYRDSINAYLNNVACTGETPAGIGTSAVLCVANGGTWNPVYPWLYNYDDIEYNLGAGELVDVAIDKLSSHFPADANFPIEKALYLGIDTSGGNDGIFGRIPAMFVSYFSEVDSLAIESRLSGSLGITFPVDGLTYTQLTKEYAVPVPDVNAPAQFVFDGSPAPTLTFQTGNIGEVRFVDPGDPGEGRLEADFALAEPAITIDMYFWDDDDGPSTGWKVCGDDGDNIPELSDCHRASLAVADPGGTHNFKLAILHVVVALDFADSDFPAAADEVNFDMDYGTPPTIQMIPATSASHARIMATFDSDDIINGTLPGVSGGTYEYDPHYHIGSTTLGDSNDGDFRAGSVDTADFILDQLTLGFRYYPELPAWALNDGWHNSIRMAYALEYEPPGTGPCIVDTTCLQLDDSPGRPRNAISLLMIAGQHDWVDRDLNGKLKNDVVTVFDAGNENNSPTFYRNRGNDKILVIDEL